MTAIVADVVLYRGDTAPVHAMRYLPSGLSTDLTGWAFLLTVHSIQNPPSTATQVYQLSAVITDATAGDFEFSVPQDDAEGTAPGTYYYDVQGSDADGLVRTIAVGTWTIKQDYTKNLGSQTTLPRLVLPPDLVAAAWPSMPFNVWEMAPGQFACTLDPDGLKPTTEATLYVKASGVDAGAGLTPGTAFASIGWALFVISQAATPLATTIYVESGTYGLAHGWLSQALTANTVLIATDDLDNPTTPGKVTCTVAPDDLVWAAVGGTDAVYSAALAAAPSIVVDLADHAGHGEGTRLVARANAAACDVPGGGWSWLAGTLSARTVGGRAPDADVLAMKAAQVNGLVNDGDLTLWASGFSWQGGTSALTMTEIDRLVLVDCELDYGTNYGLTLSTDVDGSEHELFLIRCKSRGNTGDGFQYTALGDGSITRVLEVDCIGSGNGFDGANINNGSTSHWTSGTVVVVRVGGRYDDNEGPNIADVGAENLSWNLGVEASGTVASANGSNLRTGGTMWAQSCRTRDNAADLVADAGATLYRADMPGAQTSGAGAHAEYDP